MNQTNKKTTMILVIAAIIAIIILVYYFQINSNPEEKTMKCIAKNSELYVLKTCSHCAQQKIMLRNYIDLFEITDCGDNTKKCVEDGIIEDDKVSIPSWIINGEKYTGVRTIEQLKELTGC